MPPRPPQPDPGREPALDRLARAAYSLSAADARLRGRATRTPGALSLTHARALRALAENGPLSIRELAAATETTPPGATQLVNGLVSAGYVTREQTPGRKAVAVALTAKGQERHDERQAALQRDLDAALADYDTRSLDSAAEVLRQLTAIYDRL
ncbi:MarR family winged helix-turn-helix transcriptional regulator [Streptomyces varsoviensis]|uniref:MarR family transcriptional regulator n=1 Tax=Streptomyces varsoviensis TaxID=67373 RepID=A0ABR5IWD0_9ACTN|nr:MarR family transcriptional regulator [Streptomyces varsoviensis]KOG85458.1 MarR family transcriptional regulator [Streptomyces varsoviensis]